MKVTYDDRYDLLYLALDESPQQIENCDFADGVVLDIGEDDRIVGIEILGASTLVNLSRLLPVEYEARAPRSGQA
jgi:uncharacterized protein YuzE